MLIDVYGGSSSGEAANKRDKLGKGIAAITTAQHGQPAVLPPTWKGVVLAPYVKDTIDGSGLVVVLSGEDALRLLGGLRHISFAVDAAPAWNASHSPRPAS